jgi:hypothetical protein
MTIFNITNLDLSGSASPLFVARWIFFMDGGDHTHNKLIFTCLV